MSKPFNPFLAHLEAKKSRDKRVEESEDKFGRPTRASGPRGDYGDSKAFNPFMAHLESKYEREKRKDEEEEERLYNEEYNASPEEGEDKNQQERSRNWLSRAIDQVNVLDGGRSWGQERGDDSKSSIHQGIDFASSIFEGTTQGINTLGEAGRLTGELSKIGVANLTGNKEARDAAAMRAVSDEESYLEEGRGIGGKGGWINREESANMSTGDLVNNIAGASLKTGSEIIPMGRGARALTAAKAGNIGRTTAKVAGEGAIAGGTYVTGRGMLDGQLDAKEIATGFVLGGALGGVMGNIGGRMATRKASTMARKADDALMEGVDESASKAAKYLEAEDVTRSLYNPKRQLLLGDGSENISKRIKDLDDELASLGNGSKFKASRSLDDAGIERRSLTEPKSILEERAPNKNLIRKSDLSTPDGRRSPEVSTEDFMKYRSRGKTKLEALKAQSSEPTAITNKKSWSSIIDDMYEKSRAEWGGGTISSKSGKYVPDNADSYALTVRDPGMDTVSVSPKASKAEFAKAMEEAKEKYAEILARKDSHLGVFNDADTGRIDIDPVYVTSKLDDVHDIGSYTKADGGAYHFKSGDGFWPPHVSDSAAATSTKVGQFGPEKIFDEFVIDPGGGTTTVTKGSFQNNAKRIKEIKRERASLQNEIDSLKVQKEIEPNYSPKKTETIVSKAAENAKNAKQINDNMKFSDYKGRITDNLSSFFKALEGKLESTGGGRLMTDYYQKVIGGISNRNETQKFMARTLNSKMESVVGKLSNKAKRKMGVKVGETLRKVSDNDMAELTASQISTKYGFNVKDVQVAKVLRQHFKDLLEETNKVRLERGQEAIPYRSEYMPQWSKNRITDGAGRGASTADEKFNPFAQNRTKSQTDFEKNVFKTLDQYHRYASNELHLTPVVRDLRKTSAQLREAGNENASIFLDEFIDTAILKTRTAGWDKAWGITEGSLKQRALQRISMARSLSGLAGNLRWMLVTQPQSLAVTVGKFGPINTAKGMLDYVTDSAVRKEIKNLPMYKLKRSQSVGATAGGQLDRVSDSVLKSRREFANDVMGVPANFIEQTLDGMSAAAARRNAMGHMRSGKMTKEGMRNFMQHGIEVTQSVYSAEARPMVLQNLMARSAFPFQTYSVEMWRHLNNLAKGKGAGWNQTGVDRARQATVMVSAIVLGNHLQKQLTGSDIATPGSVVPFVGAQVNQGIDWATAMFGEGTDFSSGGGAGLTSFERDLGDFAGIAGDLSDSFKGDGELPVGFSEGLEDYLNTGKADKFRKVLTRWGMGLSGVGGASTVNRMMDMAIDFNREAIKTGKGRDIPFERNAKNAVTSGMFGRGALSDVEEFYSPQGGNSLTEKEWELINVVPDEQRGAYSSFFGSLKDDPAKKSITAKKIREAIKDKNLEKARRLAAQFNKSMSYKVSLLEGEVGEIDKYMLDYLGGYMIDFDYYRNKKEK